MEPAKEDRSTKREYILIRKGQMYYYARAYKDDPDLYVIMANVGEKEGREIVEKANKTSEWVNGAPKG